MEKNVDIIDMIREKDMFARRLDIEIIDAKEGCSHVSMPLGENTSNAVGIVHGGAIFSLADLAFAAACNSEGVLSVAIETNIHYLAPCPSVGRLEAKAMKIRETRRLGFYRIEVFPPDGEIIAVLQAVAYKKGKQ